MNCLKCNSKLFGRYYCPKCKTIFRTEKEYRNSLLLIFGFYIFMVLVFLSIGIIDWWFYPLWMCSPFIIWLYMWAFTERIDSYSKLLGLSKFLK